MNKKLYLLPFLIFSINAQDAESIPVVEPVITDLDLLVESVKTTASIRAKEDRARLNKFLSDKTRTKTEKIILNVALLSFFIHLAFIYLLKLNIINFSSSTELLNNPISAIYTPFSFILIYEVYLLIYYY